jgi:hypothetical protein
MDPEWILGGLAEGAVECIQVAQDMDRCRALVKAVMDLRVLAPRSYILKYYDLTRMGKEAIVGILKHFPNMFMEKYRKSAVCFRNSV